MHPFFKQFILWFLVCSFGLPLAATDLIFPVLYKGRFRPADAYAQLWLYDFYHAQTLKTDLLATSSLDFVWSLYFYGSAPYQTLPLFWIDSATLKQELQLPLKQNRFSYQDLLKASTQNPEALEKSSILSSALQEFGRLQGPISLQEQAFRQRVAALQARKMSPAEIKQVVAQEFPVMQRLKAAGPLFFMLPSRFQAGEWFSLQALHTQTYDSFLQSLAPIGNFTAFNDTVFDQLRQAYFIWEKSVLERVDLSKQHSAKQAFESLLQEAYLPFAGQVYQVANGKQLNYPSFMQLRVESLYGKFPWIKGLIFLYALSACLFLALLIYPSLFLRRTAFTLFSLTFALHTAVLVMRCYILQRPPVSNMFETVIYVPWIAGLCGLLFPVFRRQSLVLVAASLTSLILLVLIEFADLNQHLDHVQAVLDSQFWLTIHVLLVVGSYGIFILGAVLGHFYLILYASKHTSSTPLTHLILQTMYGGTALLVPGTILGGVWAAESWGRFWDWDPKESWAFISSCFYLIWIHAYRFHRISAFGLAFGAVAGLLAISFTWYGVNYILGTGLHSYGFGSGGKGFYYAFIGAEVLFLAYMLGVHYSFSNRIKMAN